MEFSSVMLSSDERDQKQIRKRESFFANTENGAIFPCSDFIFASWSDSCAEAQSEYKTRQNIKILFMLNYLFSGS
jgi:hypothetical protein